SLPLRSYSLSQKDDARPQCSYPLSFVCTHSRFSVCFLESKLRVEFRRIYSILRLRLRDAPLWPHEPMRLPDHAGEFCFSLGSSALRGTNSPAPDRSQTVVLFGIG